jgi:hypothetical protein
MGVAPAQPTSVAIQRVDGSYVATGDGNDHPLRATRQVNQATITFVVRNAASNPTGQIRYYVEYGARDGSFFNTYTGAWRNATAMNDFRTLYGLQQNTEYFFRVYTDCNGRREGEGTIGGFYRSAAQTGYFVTNRSPNAPVPSFPANDTQFAVGGSFPLRVTVSDPDDDIGVNPPKDVRNIQFRVRRKATPTVPAGEWVADTHAISGNGPHESTVGNQPQGGQAYEWQAAVADQFAWSAWSEVRTFFLTSDVAAPILLSPDRGQGISEAGPFIFRVRHRSPTGTQMNQMTLYFRVKGQQEWRTLAVVNNPEITAGEAVYIFTPTAVGDLLQRGFQYEWTATTRTTAGKVSPQAQSSTFYVTAAPGSGVPPVPASTTNAPPLGCGVSRAFVYERGGGRMLGEITPMTKIKWTRVRDDISDCTITVDSFDDCGMLLSNLRSWQHEIVVFRDNGAGPERVWEGPVTHIQYETDRVVIGAKDVMAYVYRRVMRLGYNDSYQLETPGRYVGSNGFGQYVYGWGQVGLRSVVERAEQIILNALSYDDPNVIEYLTALSSGNDTQQSRIVKAYSKSAWQEVDDLAAKAGLDYTTVGRRIILWDTHDQIGRLPQMTDGDFGDNPIVTEYGMQTATDFVVTNNNGVYGLSTKSEGHKFYGFVEQIASAYSESESSGGTAETLTDKARQELEETLTGQAQRNIAHRYPTPLIVRVPDNTTLNPDLPLGINEIVPGVFIPLLATSTLRKVSQMQKLDNMSCTQDENGEVITVTLSPAPGTFGEDPDSDAPDEVDG